ncbi:hypothetical protein PG990_010456 [Apiospora arundinis]
MAESTPLSTVPTVWTTPRSENSPPSPSNMEKTRPYAVIVTDVASGYDDGGAELLQTSYNRIRARGFQATARGQHKAAGVVGGREPSGHLLSDASQASCGQNSPALGHDTGYLSVQWMGCAKLLSAAACS